MDDLPLRLPYCAGIAAYARERGSRGYLQEKKEGRKEGRREEGGIEGRIDTDR